MKLECSVSFGIRTPNNPCKTGKPSRAFIALGREAQSDENLPPKFYIVTRSRVRSGQAERFEVCKGNVHNVHRNQLAGGKATIAFIQPPVHLFVSEACPRKLEGFLLAIEVILANRRLKGVPLLAEVEKSCDPGKLDSRPFQLVIESRDSYPRGGQAFPNSLLKLAIRGVGLKSVDIRWFNLHQLTSLDLSQNLLGKSGEDPQLFNVEWGKFAKIKLLKRLNHLNLSSNGLKHIPDEFYTALPDSLVTLNLSNNELTELPELVCRLPNLGTLNLASNRLECLPEDLCLLKNLRLLDASSNLLGAEIPYPSVLFARHYGFDRLDISHNPNELISEESNGAEGALEYGTPSLMSISSAVVLNNKPLGDLKDRLPQTIICEMRAHCRRCHFCCKLISAWFGNLSPVKRLGPGTIAREYSGPRLIPIEQYVCNTCRSTQHGCLSR